MRIKSIIVNNILAYKTKTEFEFEQNPVYIIGENGSGKSSLLDIITTALYRRPIRTSSLNAILANPNENAYIRMKFSVGKDTYIVERHIGKKSTNKHDKIYKQDEVIYQGSQNVTKFIESLIGPLNIWITLIPQRQLTNVLDPKNFRSLYMQIFQLEKLHIFIKALNKYMNKLQTEYNTINDEYIDTKQKLDELGEFDEHELKKLEEKLNQLVKKDYIQKIKVVSNLLNDQKNKYKELQNKKKQLLQVKQIQESTKQYRYLLEETIDEYKLRYLYLNKDKLDLVKKATCIKDKNGWLRLSDKLLKWEFLWKEFQNAKKNLRKALQLSRLYDKYNQYSLQSIISAKQDFPYDYKQLKQYAVQLVSYLNDTYDLGLNLDQPYDESSISDAFKILSDHHAYITFMKDKVEVDLLDEERQLLQTFSSWEEVKAYCKNAYDTFKQLASQLSYVVVIYNKKKLEWRNIADYISEVFALADQSVFSDVKEVDHYYKILNDINVIASQCNSYAEWQTIMNTDASDETLSKLDSEINKVEKEIQTLQEQLDQLETKAEQQKQEIQQLSNQIQELKIKQNTYNQLKTLIEKHENHLNSIKRKYDATSKLQHIYEEYKVYINQKFKNTLPVFVKNLVERFGFDFNIEIDDDFNIIIHKDGNTITPQMLSGAQQSILALALRISVAKLVGSYHPIVMDEVTEGFDYNRIDLLKGFINQISQDYQTIVVSHDDRIISDNVGQIIQLGGNK